MRKIFLGGPLACGVHNEKNELEDYLWFEKDIELVDNYEDADLIVITDTCMGTYSNLEESITYLKNVLLTKKTNARVIVSGCLTKGVRFELPKEWKDILEKVEKVPPTKIREYILTILEIAFDEELKDKLKMPASSTLEYGLKFSPVEGCSNYCSFCKNNYMNFSLKSIPFEDIESYAQYINKLHSQGAPINFLQIHSSNLSLYGVDLYNEPKAHEVLNVLSKPDCIKFISASALINWYPELLKEILNNPKIKSIFISLESGSERIYNLMNRPITLKKIIQIIKTIRIYRPDIIINTEIICGFPTETVDDLDRTIELIQELDIRPIFAHPYIDSPQIPSSKLPQHSPEYIKEVLLYSSRQLQR